MEAAYGLAIIVTMLTTTILFANYLVLHRVKSVWIYIFLVFILLLKSGYFIALMDKFIHGGYITLMIGGLMFLVMYIWYRAERSRTGMWNLCGWNIIFPKYRN